MLRFLAWCVLTILAVLTWTLQLLTRVVIAAGEHIQQTMLEESTPKRKPRKIAKVVEEPVEEAEEGPSGLLLPFVRPLPPKPLVAPMPLSRRVPTPLPEKHNKKWGCPVEPGWTVEEALPKDGMRIEVNEAGERRLVHMGSGQIISEVA